MTRLAVFDFDKTLVDADSDATVIRLLSEREPPAVWEAGSMDWTLYMDDIFSQAHAAGCSKEDILSSIGAMPEMRGARELLTALTDDGWHVVVLTDSNSVFVHHWLKVHELEDKVSSVITNPARWQDCGRLAVSPHTHQTSCRECPGNLCKSLALSLYRERHPTTFAGVIYVGDGRNDVCPMRSLGAQDVVCPRVGFPCWRQLEGSPPHARVLPWSDHRDILRNLFPCRCLGATTATSCATSRADRIP